MQKAEQGAWRNGDLPAPSSRDLKILLLTGGGGSAQASHLRTRNKNKTRLVSEQTTQVFIVRRIHET